MPVRAAPRSSSFGSLVLFARRTTTSIFFFVLFFVFARVFCVWCGLQKRVVRPPPLDDDDDKESFGWCCDEFLVLFPMSNSLSRLENNFYHHTFTSSSSSAHHGERERERERDARNHHRGARVDFFISDVFFERPPRKFRSKMERRRRAMSSGLCRIDDAETTTTTKRTD